MGHKSHRSWAALQSSVPSSTIDWRTPKGEKGWWEKAPMGPTIYMAARGTGLPAFGCGRSTTSMCRKAILSTGICWRARVAMNREQELKMKQLPKPVQQRKKLDKASSFCCCFFLQLIKNENLTPRHKYTFSKFGIYFPPNFHVLAKAGRQNVALFIFPLLIFCMSMHQKHPNNNRPCFGLPLHVFLWGKQPKISFWKTVKWK